MSLLEVHELRRAYGEGSEAVDAIRDLTFVVEEGELVCLIGPSGCGKTTLLRCVSGLLRPTSGSIVFRGQHVDRPPEGMALVFQEYNRSLFPWMTVRQNVAFPLRRLPREVRRRRAEEAIGAVDLPGSIDQYPWQLSGGMQQRVAIARALAYRPSALLMDEPFASVDAQARADLEDLILRLVRRLGMTVIFVTHDIDESIYLADRILVLTGAPGRIRDTVAVGLPTPREQIETRGLSEFGRLRAELHGLIGRGGEPEAGDRYGT